MTATMMLAECPMKPTERPEFLKVLIGMAAIKPGRDVLTDEALDLWWSSMRDWSLADFKKAAAHLIKSCEFMPSPFQFEQLRKSGDFQPSEAWSIALRACVNWKDASRLPAGRIARAASCVGGFRAIAMTELKELTWIQKRFMEAYAELSDVESVREALPSIAILSDSRIALSGPTQLSKMIPNLEKGDANVE
jgi:hypothetical protein